MPVPANTPYDDRQLIQYLLDQLPPGDAVRLDEASIVDDDLAMRLRAVEEELVEAYARGTLTGETLKRFQTHYLASPRRRRDVAFTSELLRAVDRAAAPDVAVRRDSFRARTVWLMSVAATLLVVASGAMVLRMARLERALGETERSRSLLDRRTRDLERQVEELRAARTPAPREPESVRAPAPALPRELPPVALVLLPQTRAIGPMPSVAIPDGADRVGFELRLESNDAPRYQAGLRDPAVNETVWRSGWLTARLPASQPSVVVAVPARLLRPQHYTIDLLADMPRRGAEVVGSYAFEIVPR